MDKHEIATILYNLVADMDAGDFIETKDEEIQKITEQLEKIDLCTPLGYVLYCIAEENENLL